MTKRFKTIVRGGKFVALSESGDSVEPETPILFSDESTIDSIKIHYRRILQEYAPWSIEHEISLLEQCELVTIEVKVVNDIPERVKTDKTSSE